MPARSRGLCATQLTTALYTSPSLDTSSLSLEISRDIWSRDKEQKSLLFTATCDKYLNNNSETRKNIVGTLSLITKLLVLSNIAILFEPVRNAEG